MTYQELDQLALHMLVYAQSLKGNSNAVMRSNPKLIHAAEAIFFSLLMAFVPWLVGLLTGMYLWSHFGPPANDPDETSAYLCGVLLGGLMAVAGVVAILWMFWPRAPARTSR